MTSRSRYNSYSTVDGATFDSIPSHWDSARARHLVRIRTGSGDTVDAEPEGAFPFYVRSDKPLRSDTWEFDGPAVLTAGDGAGVAKVFHLVEGQFAAHQRVYVLDDFRLVTPKFFYYCFSSMFHLMALDGSAKSTVDSVRRHMIADMPMPVPNPEEQQIIVDFLDRETAQIDTLIAKQEQLIETLRERRRVLITNGTASGVPVRLRRLVIEIRQGWSPNCDPVPADGVSEWGVLKVGCSNTGYFRASENKRLPDGETPRPELAIRPGEIVMSRSNTKDLVGAASVVRRAYPRLMLSDLTYGLTVSTRADPEFVATALANESVRQQIGSAAKGTSPSMQKISQRDVLELEIRVPSVDEQHAAVRAIRAGINKIDSLITKVERFIELAKERRAALITAAVTGQLDVTKAA